MIVTIRQFVSRISQSLLSRLAAQIQYMFASPVVVFTRNNTMVFFLPENTEMYTENGRDYVE
jgi:hypothetical protein